jgi:hypothetical protein
MTDKSFGSLGDFRGLRRMVSTRVSLPELKKCRQMKKSEHTQSSKNKVNLLTLISLVCGIGIAIFAWVFYPNPYMSTKLWFFEFPIPPLSMLLTMIGILLAGIILGGVAINYSRQLQSKFQMKLAVIGLFFNSILLVLPVLNLISSFVPRTLTGVVDYKTEMGGYICVIEIGTDNTWSEEINFKDNTLIYEQPQNPFQPKRLTSVDALELGQVVEIKYIDLDTSAIWGIYPSSITILEGQYRDYKNENCGNFLESI